MYVFECFGVLYGLTYDVSSIMRSMDEDQLNTVELFIALYKTIFDIKRYG